MKRIFDFFRNSNNKDQQVVADRLANVHIAPNRHTHGSSNFNSFYAIVAGIIFVSCLFLGFGIIPYLLNNFPLGLMSSYPLNFKTVAIIIFLSLLAAVSAGSYFYYQDNGSKRINGAVQSLTENDVDDARIDLPEDLPYKYDIAPDEKVHADIDVTALLSHMNFNNRHGVHGKDGKVHFDTKFGNSLFDAASLPNDTENRIIYDTSKLAYNPNNAYGKAKGKTVKDYINSNWYVPEYEDGTQDPAGAYIVSTSSENTIVVSETRGGKGIKYIEPILDLWSRQKHQPNLVITDLKMELLRMYLRTFTLRGYNVKSLNLMVPSQTDSINFIGYAVEAAIKGDITQMEKEVSAVSDVFFVNKGNQDPMWNNAAAATFKRTIYILINYYNEKVKIYKNDAHLTVEEIAQKSDEAWGHVTLYNAYKFTVELASKSYPKAIYEDMYPKDNDGNTTDPDPAAETKSALSLYCDAIELLPTNAIRSKIADQNKAIQTTAKSEKTLASIYSVCMFGMIFFTDNTIIKLTSARPSVNLDLKGFAFPRRLGVAFNHQFANRYNLVQASTVWQAYHDPEMKKPYPEDEFRYEGNVDDFYWANAYFKGKFDDKPVYLKLTIYSRTGYISKSPNNLKLKEFAFVFKKNYRKSFSGRQYLINPITGKREVQGGEMHEYTYDARTGKVHQIRSGVDVKEPSLLFSDNGAMKTKVRYTIESYDIHYTDKPTALFLVTSEPSYNKVLLMTLNNLYDQQVALCKVAVGNQKPMVPTKYMLDEFGNIKSEGQGVPKLDEKLSSGLGFNQQFTLILQNLSQLTSLYDNSVKQTLIANSANFFYMKSKDKEMIHQLMDMNGKIHVPVRNSITMQDNRHKPSNAFGDPKNKAPHQSPSVSYSREERPLLDENAYLKLNDKASDGNAIVSRGNATIVSIRDTIMPVSYKLLAHNLGEHGGTDTKSAPESLPTMADTGSFNALQNLPDFDKMTAEAIEQAKMAPKVVAQFKKVTHKTDHDIMLMDPELYSDQIMSGIRANLKAEKEKENNADLNNISMHGDPRSNDEHFNYKFDDVPIELQSSYTNKALKQGDQAADFVTQHAKSLRDHILAKSKHAFKQQKDNSLLSKMKKSVLKNKDFNGNEVEQEQKVWYEKRYADHHISRLDLMQPNHTLTGTYDYILSTAFSNCYSYFKNDSHFILTETDQGPELQTMDQQPAIEVAKSEDGSELSDSLKFVIRPAFVEYLVKQDTWKDIANGRFETAVVNSLKEHNLITE